MVISINTSPGQDYAFIQSVELDAITIRLAFRWYPIPGRWMMTVKAPNGEPLAMPQMVSPGGNVLMDVRDPRVPPGRLYWQGRDPYTRESLGDTVVLMYEPLV